jgi:hypothetical protein
VVRCILKVLVFACNLELLLIFDCISLCLSSVLVSDNVEIMIFFSGAEIDLPRTKLNADEQMCWYIYDTFIEKMFLTRL